MGSGNWDSSTWDTYRRSTFSGQNVRNICQSRNLQDKYNPAMIDLRESRDSDDHPLSTPIILGLDVTGSMNRIVEKTADNLGTVVEEILTRQPVSHPQIMMAAIGDAYSDHAPLQITQFESDLRIAKQITDLWFEGNGGSNGAESYPMLWAFAKHKIQTDNWEKRHQKGIIFTMGDDGVPPMLTREQLKRVINIDTEGDVLTPALYDDITRQWEVFHLCLEQGNTYRSSDFDNWRKLMGENAISVMDYTMIPQIIVSILERLSGKSVDAIVKSWHGDDSTALVLHKAISGLTARTSTSTSVVKL